ncbi:MAG: cation:proton antiporter [Candidatus Nanohaloarchaea archaeon]
MTFGLIEGFAVLIAVAALTGIIARKTGQPLVIAYILTGLLLGPVGLSLISENELTSMMSELGLVFLLFLIGLEINIDEIREVLGSTVFIGLSQMLLTLLLGYGLGTIFGLSNIGSVIFGVAAMFSSTALVVKLLTDRDEAFSLPGRLDIGVLLIQDVAVILILALITADASSIYALLERILEIAAMIGFIGGLSYLSSRYVVSRIFKDISDNQHAFFIHGIAFAFIFISTAHYLNLSMEIGAFFAGLSFAQLPYSRELQERVRPLTNLFMAIFFINFGLQIVPGELTAYIGEAVLASAVLVLGKFSIVFFLVDRSKFTPETSFRSALNLTQVSEFSLVLAALAFSQGLVGSEIVGLISLVTVMTMATSSYLIIFSGRIKQFAEPLLERLDSEEKKDIDMKSLENHALVIGYDEVTRHLLPVLEQDFDDVVVVDSDPEDIDELARSDYKFIYGDFRHGDIRKAASLQKADFIISVVPDFEVNREIVEYTGLEPTVFVKADSIEQAGELYDMGAHYVMIRNILTGEKMKDYIRLYLEDRDLFLEEVKPDIDKINYGGRR